MPDLVVNEKFNSPAVRPASDVGLFSSSPAATIEFASKVATVMRDVFEKQKLYAEIQGKKFPKVEAWTTMGAMLGIIPKERSIVELSDGSYEATVDLVSVATGHVIGGASALCGKEEKRWSHAERYAVRSMAVTRATSKAYRLGFSWIMTLAGYEATPAEEIPDEPRSREAKTGIYDAGNVKAQEWLFNELSKRNFSGDFDKMSKTMHGKSAKDLDDMIKSEVEKFHVESIDDVF